MSSDRNDQDDMDTTVSCISTTDMEGMTLQFVFMLNELFMLWY